MEENEGDESEDCMMTWPVDEEEHCECSAECYRPDVGIPDRPIHQFNVP